MAADQRRRLFDALVAAVSANGYPATTVDEVTAGAGVSKRDFYVHFESKEDCFLQAFDELLESFARKIEAAAPTHGEVAEQVREAIEALARIIADEPEALQFLLVDSLTIGPAGNDPRERSQERFEAMLEAAFRRMPESRPVSEFQRRAIVIGLRLSSYRAIRDRSADSLLAAAPALSDWVLAYPTQAGRTSPTPPQQPVAAAAGEGPTAVRSGAEDPAEADARKRILWAAAELCCQVGYRKLTIQGVSARARVSNRTFYQHFESKEEALLAAFEGIAQGPLRATAEAFASRTRWPRQAEAALYAFLGHVQSDTRFRQLAFLELPAIGRLGLRQIDLLMDDLKQILSPAKPDASGQDHIIRAATIGGVWGALRHEIVGERIEKLTALAPEAVDFVIVGLSDLR